MWFRVELYKDGSVKSCVTVEARAKTSSLVIYVDASNDVDALSKAHAWRTKYLARARANRERFIVRRGELGQCLDCVRKALVGKKHCQEHHRLRSMSKEQRRKLPKDPNKRTVHGPSYKGMSLRKMRVEYEVLLQIQEILRTQTPTQAKRWVSNRVRQHAEVLEESSPKRKSA